MFLCLYRVTRFRRTSTIFSSERTGINSWTADYMNAKYGSGTFTLRMTDSYYNMKEKLTGHMHLIRNAEIAMEKAGVTPQIVTIRGGTDGATLSWNGLPCPNLGTGGFNFHGVCECTTVERMDRCTEIVLNIISLYAE